MTQLFTASFPVVFFDGERDIDVGSVAVTPTFDFNKFQWLIAQKFGLSPQQISISLVRRKKARCSPEIQKKVPIDESSDFAAISCERDCFVLVAMKRSRSGRRGRGRRGRGGDGDGGDEKKTVEVPEVTILKRNQGERIPAGSVGPWGYDAQMDDLMMMRVNYLMSTAGCYKFAPSSFGFPAPPATTPVCGECEDAGREGRSPGFHWCVYDRVTFGFRSPAGPIERPTKMNTGSFNWGRALLPY